MDRYVDSRACVSLPLATVPIPEDCGEFESPTCGPGKALYVRLGRGNWPRRPPLHAKCRCSGRSVDGERSLRFFPPWVPGRPVERWASLALGLDALLPLGGFGLSRLSESYHAAMFPPPPPPYPTSYSSLQIGKVGSLEVGSAESTTDLLKQMQPQFVLSPAPGSTSFSSSAQFRLERIP